MHSPFVRSISCLLLAAAIPALAASAANNSDKSDMKTKTGRLRRSRMGAAAAGGREHRLHDVCASASDLNMKGDKCVPSPPMRCCSAPCRTPAP